MLGEEAIALQRREIVHQHVSEGEGLARAWIDGERRQKGPAATIACVPDVQKRCDRFRIHNGRIFGPEREEFRRAAAVIINHPLWIFRVPHDAFEVDFAVDDGALSNHGDNRQIGARQRSTVEDFLCVQ